MFGRGGGRPPMVQRLSGKRRSISGGGKCRGKIAGSWRGYGGGAQQSGGGGGGGGLWRRPMAAAA